MKERRRIAPPGLVCVHLDLCMIKPARLPRMQIVECAATEISFFLCKENLQIAYEAREKMTKVKKRVRLKIKNLEGSFLVFENYVYLAFF